MNEQLFQILVILFSGIVTIVSILIGFAVRSFLVQYKEDKQHATQRANKHSTRLDDHESRLIKAEAAVAANYKADEARMEFMKLTYSHIEKGIDEIKKEQKTIDTRLTDYIINGKGPKK